MGFMDTDQGMVRGKQGSVKSGIDKGADAIKDKVPDEHAGKVDQGAQAAKDAVDKID